jgi:hypothetical protein
VDGKVEHIAHMTTAEAKALIIDGINYMAYRETAHSLWPSAMNTWFGEDHYPPRPVFSASVWGDGSEFEQRMADLLRCAVRAGTTKGNDQEALAILKDSDGSLGRVIRKAGF